MLPQLCDLAVQRGLVTQQPLSLSSELRYLEHMSSEGLVGAVSGLRVR